MTEPLSSNSWNPPLHHSESVYPFNTVHKSRSGHVHEIDDTIGAERIHRQHKSGSCETFKATGDRVINIVGDDWITIVKDGHIYIGGRASVTIMSDCEMTVEGNYNLHVKKDFNLTVDGKIKARSNGGIMSDVVGDVGLNVSENVITRINGSQDHKCIGDQSIMIGGSSKSVVSGNHSVMTGKNSVNVAAGKSVITSGGTLTLGSTVGGIQMGAMSGVNINAPAGVNIELGNLYVTQNITTLGSIFATGIIFSSTDVLANVISLSYHLHPETGTVTLPPIP